MLAIRQREADAAAQALLAELEVEEARSKQEMGKESKARSCGKKKKGGSGPGSRQDEKL